MGLTTTAYAECGIAAVTCPGETVSGDRCVLREHGRGMLIAGLDGVGHGPQAARASEVAAELLEAAPARPVADLLDRCHRGLHGTRGVATFLASYEATHRTLTWAGVGDVLGVLLRARGGIPQRRELMLPRVGVLGHGSPPMTTSSIAIGEGDLLVIATDGVRDEFVELATTIKAPEPLAQRILARYVRGTDDALVVVARFRESGS